MNIVIRKDLYSSETLFELSRCTNPNKQQCSRVDQYLTQMINLTLSEGTPKTNAQIVTTIELKLAEQPNGVVSLVETAVIAGPCESDTLVWTDPCYDMDYPCNSNHCLKAGNLTVYSKGSLSSNCPLDYYVITYLTIKIN